MVIINWIHTNKYIQKVIMINFFSIKMKNLLILSHQWQNL